MFFGARLLIGVLITLKGTISSLAIAITLVVITCGTVIVSTFIRLYESILMNVINILMEFSLFFLACMGLVYEIVDMSEDTLDYMGLATLIVLIIIQIVCMILLIIDIILMLISCCRRCKKSNKVE